MSNSAKLLPAIKGSIHFDTLFEQVKQSIQTYAAQTWTDTGEHDPGITLIEGLCYGISDLAYRNTLPLTDLLTPPLEDQTAGDGIFPADFGPQMALTTGPITEDDYRRALLDLYDTDGQYFYFRNVQMVAESDDFIYWYDTDSGQFSFNQPTPVDGSTPVEFKLRGNYTLYVEPSRAAQSDENTAAAAALDDFITNNRNLGELISHVIWVAPQAINVATTIEIEDDVQDIAGLLAAIYTATESYISPYAQRCSAETLVEQGEEIEEIYQGPYLQHGWITQLPPETDYTEIVTVDLGGLAKVWMEIEGVKSILSIGTHDNPNSWSWESYKNNLYPLLWDENPISSMIEDVKLLTVGGEYVTATEDDIENSLVAAPVLNTVPVVMAYGKPRDTAQYHPVSDKLPPCYGLQEQTITDPEIQLYQFLLPFEQAAANGCAQLAMLPQLLSFERSGSAVWGAQWPYAPGSIGDSVHRQYKNNLLAQINSNANDSNQELAVLNHLLGYFGTQAASRMLDTTQDEFLEVEQDYLGQITDLAYHRDNIRVDQVSALQKRIAARLGFGSNLFADGVDMGTLPFYLVEHRVLMPQQPSSSYDAPMPPDSVTVPTGGSIMTVTQADPSLKSLFKGQLINFVLEDGLENHADTADYIIQACIVDEVDVANNTFSLDLTENPQLSVLVDQVVSAANTGGLQWQNCQVWLRDIDYKLSYASDQTGVPDSQKKTGDSQSLPFSGTSAAGRFAADQRPTVAGFDREYGFTMDAGRNRHKHR